MFSCFEAFIPVMNGISYTCVGNKTKNMHENFESSESIPRGIVPPILSLT